MVYCGKPSKSCEICRRRKRRCDKQIPSCGQCIRMGQRCPGYRDTLSLAFRDETDNVIKRLNAQGKKSTSSRSSPNVSANDVSPSRELSGPSVSLGISPTEKDLGLNYFLRNIVIGSTKHSRGYLDYVSDIYVADNYNEILLGSMSAVGLASLAKVSNQPERMPQALDLYGATVQKINIALDSTTEAVRDGTLMATIILGLFEQMKGEAAWARHIFGATGLIALRGPDQFRSSVGMRMFTQLSGDLILASLHGRIPFPRHMILLRAEAVKYVAPDDFVWMTSDQMVRCTDFLWRRLDADSTQLAEVLAEAREIDRDYQSLFQLLDDRSPFRKISHAGLDPERFPRGGYDLYEDIWAIRVWNAARIGRIFLHETIRKHLIAAGPGSDCNREIAGGQFQDSVRLILQMRDDIFASVPQALAYIPASESDGVQTPPTDKGDGPVQVTGPNLVYWHLYVAAKTSATHEEDRVWAIRHLKVIGRMGTVSALKLAHELETKRPSIFDR